MQAIAFVYDMCFTNKPALPSVISSIYLLKDVLKYREHCVMYFIFKQKRNTDVRTAAHTIANRGTVQKQ